jgi:hypothetical protein
MRRLLFTSTALAAMAVTTAASADTWNYASYTVLDQQNVSIGNASPPVNEAGGAGQITLSGGTAPTGGFAAWCVDVQDLLQGSGTFTISPREARSFRAGRDSEPRISAVLLLQRCPDGHRWR